MNTTYKTLYKLYLGETEYAIDENNEKKMKYLDLYDAETELELHDRNYSSDISFDTTEDTIFCLHEKYE